MNRRSQLNTSTSSKHIIRFWNIPTGKNYVTDQMHLKKQQKSNTKPQITKNKQENRLANTKIGLKFDITIESQKCGKTLHRTLRSNRRK